MNAAGPPSAQRVADAKLGWRQGLAAAIFVSMATETFDLAIVGAGLNGSLLALAAGEAGLRTALIDRMPLTSLTEMGFDGRTTAVAYTSQRLFAAVGVWDGMAAEAEPILDIRISDASHDGRASPLFLHFDHREAAENDESAAPMGWIVENRFLRAAMLRRLAGCPRSNWWRLTRSSRPARDAAPRRRSP